MNQESLKSIIKRRLSEVPNVLKYSLIGLVALIIFGIGGSILIMGLNIIDSFYFTIVTIATLGYGDIVPLTEPQKIFSFTLAIGGVGLVAFVFSLIIRHVSEKIEELRSDVKMRKKIESLKDHYILCGYGRVGAVVVAELQKKNQKVVIIDNNKETIEKLEDEGNIFAIHGDATEKESLENAGIEKAIGLILATGNDVDNVFTTLTAREISKNLWIVSRAVKKESISLLEDSGANSVISPAKSGGGDIYSAAIKPNLIEIKAKHDVNDIKKEMEIILNHNCEIENIEYHYPHLKEPLKRKIEVSSKEKLDKFSRLMEEDKEFKKSLELLYESVNGIHIHLISGPNKETLDKLIESLKKENLILDEN